MTNITRTNTFFRIFADYLLKPLLVQKNVVVSAPHVFGFSVVVVCVFHGLVHLFHRLVELLFGGLELMQHTTVLEAVTPRLHPRTPTVVD